jgi:DNA-binding NarL/FixJ family response regulator
VPKQVLVVDDHPGVALALRVSFRLDGRFEVADSARTAAEGLAKLDGDRDVLVLDLHLPDLAGPDLVRAFRSRRPDLPIVLHSASADAPEVDAVRRLVDAVTLKSDDDGLLAELARLTGA